MSTMTDRVFETSGLSISYNLGSDRVVALRSVDFQVSPGEFHLLCGPSGGGKSTLIKALGGLIPAVIRAKIEGAVRLFGKDIQTLSRPEIAQQLGIVFQNPDDYFLTTSVETEIAFGLENLRVPRPQMIARVAEILTLIGLPGLGRRSLASLSGGQKQRVAIGCCLAMNARALLLDEPFTNLDPQGALEVISLLADLKGRGVTIVLVTQRLFPELLALVERLTVLQGGAVIYHGRPAFSPGREAGGPPDPAQYALAGMYRRVPGPRRPFTKPSAGDGPLVTFSQVDFTYPGTKRSALENVSCTFHRGEIVALLGANGAGKSTLVRHINGLLRPQRGQVVTLCMDTRKCSVANLARHVGFMFQNPLHTIFSDTVRDELSFAAGLGHVSQADVDQRIGKVAGQLGIGDVLDKSPFVLSAGQQQRVAIGATLTGDPEVLILDEPTHGLDEETLERLERLLAELSAQGHLVLVVTHDVDLAYTVASRAILLKDGRVFADGPARDILAEEDVTLEAGLLPPTHLRGLPAGPGKGALPVPDTREAP
jgi:energy-coupling factor transport system ATP-binding protein